jgi:hypothetical protein
MSARIVSGIGRTRRTAFGAKWHVWPCLAVGGLLATLGCAEIASGPHGTYLDATGQPSAAAASAARVAVSCGETVSLSSRNFGVLEFTFENATESWQQVEKVQLDFGGQKINQAVSIPWGSQLESWAVATNQRNAIDAANRGTALEILTLTGELVSLAAPRHHGALRAAGGIVSLASADVLIGDHLQGQAETVEQTPNFSGNHLLALPFDIPPGLFAKRWIVLSTSADPKLGCISAVTLTYELADKTSYQVALAFRNTASSEWQRAACLAKYPNASYDGL